MLKGRGEIGIGLSPRTVNFVANTSFTLRGEIEGEYTNIRESPNQEICLDPVIIRRMRKYPKPKNISKPLKIFGVRDVNHHLEISRIVLNDLCGGPLFSQHLYGLDDGNLFPHLNGPQFYWP